MEEVRKWVEASLDIIRAAFAPDAPDAVRRHAAAACVTLNAMLGGGNGAPWFAPPPEPEPNVFDVLVERLMPLLPNRPGGFVVPTPTGPASK